MIPWSVHSALRVFFKLMISNSTSIRPIPSLVSAASLSFSSSVKATWRNTLAMSTLKPVRCLGRDDEVGDTGGISGEGGQGEDATDSSVTRRFSQEVKEDDGEENTPPEIGADTICAECAPVVRRMLANIPRRVFQRLQQEIVKSSGE